jgi:hypothetical protein
VKIPGPEKKLGKKRKNKMSPDAKQISSPKSSFAAAALIVVFSASCLLARAQDASQQTAPKPTATHRPAQLAWRAEQQQKTFASPQQAAQALYDAARKHDADGVIAILGPSTRNVVFWTDDQAQRFAQEDNFAKKYEQMHRFVAEPDNETTVYIGAENWPLPFPLVKSNGSWFFDSDLGKKEILFRRIGENEMDSMDALRGIVAAEHQYDDTNAQYSRLLNCSQGQHDGLFAPENGTDMDKNAIGPYLAQASYKRSDRTPFHGYYFVILTAQGPHAHGGARNYIVDGKMTGGFAAVAFPAEYRSSGVKTIMINEHGTMYEKDLGPKTTDIASSLKAYDPDTTWTRVRANQFLMTTTSPNP